jgi:hypothetical protein
MSIQYHTQEAAKWHKSGYAFLATTPRSCQQSCYATLSSDTTLASKNTAEFPPQILKAPFPTVLHTCCAWQNSPQMYTNAIK